MNNFASRSGEMNPGTIVAVNIIILISAVSFSASMYLVSKIDSIASSEKSQALIDLQQKQIQSLNKNIDSLRKELGVEKVSASQTASELAQKISATQAQTAAAEAQRQQELAQTTQKLSELEKGVSAVTAYNIPQTITEWRPRIAYVECDWKNSSGFVYQTQSGSGIITQERNGYPAVVTNEHVVVDQTTGTPTSQCRIQLPDYGKTITVPASQISKSSAGYDWARIDLDNSDTYINNLASKGFSICSEVPALGTNIVILGYPGIGSQTDITATEGIVSGYDSNYFITSAKVEHGNSGGAAISLPKNCYLGIPTFTKTGGIESLARILDAQYIFPAQ